MGNIIWKNADASVSVSATVEKASTTLAVELLSQGAVPYDSVPVAFNVEADLLPKQPVSCWKFDRDTLCVDVALYKEWTKQRLRAERQPLLEKLDVDFRRALGSGFDKSILQNLEIEANRLRNITKQADACDSVEHLDALHC